MDYGTYPVTETNQTPNAVAIIVGVRPVGISSSVEREIARTAS